MMSFFSVNLLLIIFIFLLTILVALSFPELREFYKTSRFLRHRLRNFSRYGRQITPFLHTSGKDYISNPVAPSIWIDEILTACNFARSFKPDLIIGVHPGGRLLSTYIARQINMPAHKCKFAHTEPIRAAHINLTTNAQLSGNVLIVDDITRSGNTLRVLETKIRSEYQRSTSESVTLAFLVLVMVDRIKNDTLFSSKPFIPDYLGRFTEDGQLYLPWSLLSQKIRHNFNCFAKKLDYDRYYLDLHERIVQDFELAAKIAEMALRDPEAFESSIINKKF